MDQPAIEKLLTLCQFSYVMEDGYCTSISFHDEIYGSTIRRHPLKSEIVSIIARFPYLKRLNLRKSRVATPPVFHTESLEFLDLSCNDLTVVPTWISRQQNLKTLNLGANRLQTVPDLTELPLDVLKLHKNVGIDHFPKVKDLRSLNLFMLPKLRTIPQEVFAMQRLETFSFGVSEMREVPVALFGLTNMRWLTLAVNAFESIPDELCSLPKLEKLWIVKNQLKQLPKNIGNLKCLRWLSLYSNKLETLPDSFFDLTLEKFSVEKNPLDSQTLDRLKS